MKSYLTGRTQTVRIANTYSKNLTVLCGVPQGTVLGPLLFILYINDLFKILDDDEILSFADDTVLLIKSSSWSTVQQIAEHKINIVANWLRLNCLSLNVNKTNYITYGINVNSVPIETKYKYTPITVTLKTVHVHA